MSDVDGSEDTSEETPEADAAREPEGSDGEGGDGNGAAGEDPPGPSAQELIDSGDLDDVVVAAIEAEMAKVAAAEDRMLRAVAEADNQKKRIEREFKDRARFANEGLLHDLLNVFDSLELGLAQSAPGEQADASISELHKGVELALEQFLSVFEGAGVKPIECEVGAPFDPKVHEALLRDDEVDLPAQTVAKIMQRGFLYHERILRPARVVVSTGKGHKG